MADLGAITVQLRADASQFTQGMQAAQAQVGQFSSAAGGAAGGTRMLTSSLVLFGEQAANVNPIIARLTEGVIVFGAGHEVALGVAAGLAAIGVAMRVLGSDTRDTTDAFKELAKIGPIAAARSAVHLAEENLQAAQAAFAENHLGPSQLPSFGKRTISPEVMAQGNEPFLTAIANAKNKLLQAENALAEATDQGSDRVAAARKRAMEQDQRDIDQLDQLESEVLDLQLAQVQENMKVWQETQQIMGKVGQAQNPMGSLAQMWWQVHTAAPDMPDAAELGRMGNAADAMTDKFKDETNKRMEEIGVDAVASLVAGILRGTKSFANTLKAIMVSFVEMGIKLALTSALGIASPSTFGMALGANVGASMAAGMMGEVHGVQMAALRLAQAPGPSFQGTATMNIHMPPLPSPLSPFDAARLGDWQRLFSETVNVAKSRGVQFK